MADLPHVIDYQPGDGRIRRRVPPWLIVLLVVTLFLLANAGIGHLLMAPTTPPTDTTPRPAAVP